jgi:hypothetical protein
MSATPIGLIESYFDLELDHTAVKALARKPIGIWIDFAKQYQATMDAFFGSEFLPEEPGTDGRVRLYCEPLLSVSWDASVRHLYGALSPLLGHAPDPETEVDAAVASRMLEPLKKHLLIADSVYIRDSFYYCFDCSLTSHPGHSRIHRRTTQQQWLPASRPGYRSSWSFVH